MAELMNTKTKILVVDDRIHSEDTSFIEMSNKAEYVFTTLGRVNELNRHLEECIKRMPDPWVPNPNRAQRRASRRGK